MVDPFGGHKLAIPFRSVAESLALFRGRDPQRTAITDIDQKTSITFDQLDLVTGAIANDLGRRGVRRGDAVVLLANEVLEKLLLWLGIWRIGATVCPITVELNEVHLSFIANLVEPKLLLIHDELDERIFQDGVAPVVRFGRWQPAVTDRGIYFRSLPNPAEPTGDDNAPEDIAGMVCTSGTTDRPKIVVYDHGCYWLQG
ncbi:MAG: acyl--CoA ligase, partial [Alphaproteobacteria bacterium]|nr:acyl--CoA ligase [Alphaproteobacteria bacterium]